MGFETFPELFDESYDEIFDPKLRYERVFKSIQDACNMDKKKLNDLYHSVLVDKVKFNQDLYINYDRKIIYPSWNRLPCQVKSREDLILVLNKLQIPYSLWFDNPLYQSNEKTRLLNNYNKELYPCSKKVSEHIINLTVSRSVNWYYIKKLKKIADRFN